MIIELLVKAIRTGTIFLFGCTGETITEKSGNLNLGIPGIMCIGTFGGCWGVAIYMSSLSGAAANGFLVVLTAIIFSALLSMFAGSIYAFLTVTLRANQNVAGLTLTTFGIGFMKFFGSRINMQHLLDAKGFFTNLFPFADKLGWFGQIFFSHGIFVYLSIILALAASYVLSKTRVGLRLRAVGENPGAADAVGINVTKYKYFAILIGSVIAGLGGLYYVMDKSGGTTFVEASIDSFGWLAVALVIFTVWRPNLAILGSIVFGGLKVASTTFDIPLSMIKLFEVIPYFVTIIVLIITSMINGKETQPPASLGVNYLREER